eukprot:gnl/TRDRNA2_/TRDRNA2_192167_c0_seq1.p1 gnl/TRDRNA2_/TRDRNA2_192167_c0~~gnl/TRDRNA2_/TRDRNA2_192167_c0_seq1.p1  ORF type:complete len:273 (-),score=55.59 gnl/TRDRNA2_/TRDRNA2_192167_c0_seq1:2-787(-)
MEEAEATPHMWLPRRPSGHVFAADPSGLTRFGFDGCIIGLHRSLKPDGGHGHGNAEAEHVRTDGDAEVNDGHEHDESIPAHRHGHDMHGSRHGHNMHAHRERPRIDAVAAVDEQAKRLDASFQQLLERRNQHYRETATVRTEQLREDEEKLAKLERQSSERTAHLQHFCDVRSRRFKLQDDRQCHDLLETETHLSRSDKLHADALMASQCRAEDRLKALQQKKAQAEASAHKVWLWTSVQNVKASRFSTADLGQSTADADL